MGKIYEFLKENWVVIFVIVVACFCAWIRYDARRNDRIYNDTESTITELGSRIDSAGERIDSATERVTEAEKTVSTATERITAGAELATEIADGVTECERRLDSAIQRNGRIKNIIEEIKRTAK